MLLPADNKIRGQISQLILIEVSLRKKSANGIILALNSLPMPYAERQKWFPHNNRLCPRYFLSSGSAI
jgi:hypothetical protein